MSFCQHQQGNQLKHIDHCKSSTDTRKVEYRVHNTKKNTKASHYINNLCFLFDIISFCIFYAGIFGSVSIIVSSAFSADIPSLSWIYFADKVRAFDDSSLRVSAII